MHKSYTHHFIDTKANIEYVVISEHSLTSDIKLI